jgi:seryl-tRNA synthetase
MTSEGSQDFRAALIGSALLIPTGMAGIYGLGGTFEKIAAGVNALITARGADLQAVRVNFPPVLSLASFQRTNYAASFPDLIGAVFTFAGDDRDHAAIIARHEREEEWRQDLRPADLMLVSAACHPVFAMFAGQLPASGQYADVLGYCFRHEISDDPMRMQVFRQHEYVYLGSPAEAMAHRAEWIGRGLGLLQDLGLDVAATTANDPFFGRAGRMLAAMQRDNEWKTELTLGTGGPGEQGGMVALASVNYHADHFGHRFGIFLPSQDVAHSACVGFGLERITLALLRLHGLDTGAWPGPVRKLLCL